MSDRKPSGLKILLIVLVVIGFAFMEFPGVFFFKNISEPYLFGMPFIYGYILCWWAFMCIVLFIAHAKNWGEKPPDENADKNDSEGGDLK